MNSLRPEVQYLLQFPTITNDGRDIARAIRDRSAIAVSDASVKKSRNSAAISWIITNTFETFYSHGASGCPSFHQALDSYASESFGILVLLTVVKIMCDYYHIKRGSITIACDNDSSLEKCIRNTYRANDTEKYFDLFWAVFDMRESMRIKIKHKYVSGHQDGKKKKLNIYERLNVLCDERSKEFRSRIDKGEVNHRPIQYGDDNWNVTLGSLRISAKLKESIQDHILGTRLINKMIRRQDISKEAVAHVDWTMMGGASKSQTAGDRLWLAKFVSGFAATAVQMTYRDQKKTDEKQDDFDQDFRRWKSDLCPLCKLHRETQFHVLDCESTRAKKFRNKTHTALSEWMEQQHTDPIINQCFMLVLTGNGNISFTTAMERYTNDVTYHEAVRSQDLIGYYNFQFGRISKAWKFLQETHLHRHYNGKRYSHEAWTKRFIYQLYRRLRDIWRKRCDSVHGSRGKATSKRERKAIKEDIKIQFRLGINGVRAAHRELLNMTQQQVLNSSLRYKRYWIRTLKTSREYMQEFEGNMFTGMRSIMKNWASVPI